MTHWFRIRTILSLCLVFCFTALISCGPGFEPHGDSEGNGPIVRSIPQGLSVGEAVGRYCSTSAVDKLSRQLFAELNCLRANTLNDFGGFARVQKSGSHVYTYLQTAAANSLKKVLASRSGSTLQVNSALRSLAQQYLLYRWYKQRRCGIGLAASPGSSNHESALAVDVGSYSSWRSAFQSNGWRWLGSSDPVHFDFSGSGTINIRGLSIKAFQRLWNRNNPNDKIAEDGAYGPQTEARLAKSPADGFKQSGCVDPPKLTAKFMGQSAPGAYGPKNGAQHSLCPGQSFKFSFTLQNTGNINWTDVNQSQHGRAVRLGHRAGTRFGNDARISVNNSDNKDVKPGEKVTFTMSAKASTRDGAYRTEWQLVSENVAWFGPDVWLSFDVSSAPAGSGKSCDTGKSGACAKGTMQCSEGKLTCLPPANCDKPVEPPPQREPPPQPEPTASEPTVPEPTTQEPIGVDAGTHDSPVSEPSTQAPDTGSSSAGERPQGPVLVLDGGAGGKCLQSGDCTNQQVCLNGQCVAQPRPGGCGCVATYPEPSAPFHWLAMLLGLLLIRRRR